MATQGSSPSNRRCRLGGHPARLVVVALAGLAAAGWAEAAERPVTLVVCAPGYPGSTTEAQPAMDALARVAAAAAGWSPGELRAIYFETEPAGLDRLAAPDAALALVPLPFWLQHREALGLSPRLQAVPEGGEAAQRWSLVAAAGVVKGPSQLAGFEILSPAGYAPRFIRGPVLGSWGPLPPSVAITFSSAVLTGLRKAADGARVAVLLNATQSAALPKLPLADRLEMVARSGPLPVAVLCLVRARIPADEAASLLAGLASLHHHPAGAQALAGVRLTRFVDADQHALSAARDAFEQAGE